MRLRELAASRVRFGYRRLTVLLKREGWTVNAKRIYRLYTEEGLTVRTKHRKKAASCQRVPQGFATAPNQRWSMDFVSDRLVDGCWFRVLTVIDQFTWECLLLLVDSALSGKKVAAALESVVSQRGVPLSITVDNGSEFASRAMDAWAYQHGIHLAWLIHENWLRGNLRCVFPGGSGLWRLPVGNCGCGDAVPGGVIVFEARLGHRRRAWQDSGGPAAGQLVLRASASSPNRDCHGQPLAR
jgi:Integrase core domain/HTH-like domain